MGEKCHFCGKMCKNLKRHIYVVHKQAVSCPDCPRVFQAQLGMEQHRKREHGFGIYSQNWMRYKYYLVCVPSKYAEIQETFY